MTTKSELAELIARMADLIVRQAEQLDQARRARDQALAATAEDLRDRRIRTLESQNANLLRDLQQRQSAGQAYAGRTRIEPTQSDSDSGSLDVLDEQMASHKYP